MFLNLQQANNFFFWEGGYIEFNLSVRLSVLMSCKRNSSVMDEPLLMKLYTIAVYILMICMKEENQQCMTCFIQCSVYLQLVCSGNGVCECGKCVCSPNYEGDKCQDCPVSWYQFLAYLGNRPFYPIFQHTIILTLILRAVFQILSRKKLLVLNQYKTPKTVTKYSFPLPLLIQDENCFCFLGSLLIGHFIHPCTACIENTSS